MLFFYISCKYFPFSKGRIDVKIYHLAQISFNDFNENLIFFFITYLVNETQQKYRTFNSIYYLYRVNESFLDFWIVKLVEKKIETLKVTK